MTQDEIKQKLREIGITMTGIARELNVTPTSVYDVIRGRGVSHRIHSHIGKEIGLSISLIWPDLYDEKCLPRKAGRKITKGTTNVNR